MAQTLAINSEIDFSRLSIDPLTQEERVSLQTFAETYALPLLKSLYAVLNTGLNRLPYTNVPLGDTTLADLSNSMDTVSVSRMVGEKQQTLKDLIKFDEAGCIILLVFIAIAACLAFALLGTGGGGGGGGGSVTGGSADNRKESTPVDCDDYTDPAAWIAPKCWIKDSSRK